MRGNEEREDRKRAGSGTSERLRFISYSPVAQPSPDAHCYIAYYHSLCSCLVFFHQSFISVCNPMMHHLLLLFCVDLNQLQSTRLDEEDFFFLLFSNLPKDQGIHTSFLLFCSTYSIYGTYYRLVVASPGKRLKQVFLRILPSYKKLPPSLLFCSHTLLTACNTSGSFQQAY